MPKTDAEFAAETDNELKNAKTGADGGGEGGSQGEEGGGQGAAGGAGGQDDFSDDDLDPDKLEPLLRAPQPKLDNNGLLKRFRKVHSRLKEVDKWRGEVEPKYKEWEPRIKGLDTLVNAIYKLRAQDKPEEAGFMEHLLDQILMGKPDWKAAHEAIGRMLNPASSGGQGQQAQNANPEYAKLLKKVEDLEKARFLDEEDRKQAALDAKVADEFRQLPKNLSAKPEFKGLPWKEKDFVKKLEDLTQNLALAWMVRNEKAPNPQPARPILDFGIEAAKIFLQGGSAALSRQVRGGNKTGLRLTGSDNPGGAPQRKLPTPGDPQSEFEYLQNLTAETEEQLGMRT